MLLQKFFENNVFSSVAVVKNNDKFHDNNVLYRFADATTAEAATEVNFIPCILVLEFGFSSFIDFSELCAMHNY